jgi:cytochrome c oxidase subunit 2
MRLSMRYAILGGLTLLMSACQTSRSFLVSSSPIPSHEAELYREILIEAAVIFVLITAALIWILLRYRAKGDKSLPAQVHGRAALLIVPLVLIVAVDSADFVLMFQTMSKVQAPPPSSRDLNVQVVGHRWWWEFDYPDLGIATANELHIPVGTPVQISLKSADVIHSFWVPQLSGKTDVIPGQHNTMWMMGEQPGIFFGQCSEFCGTEHALMRLRVIVDSQADFDAWVANQQAPAAPPQTPQEQVGYEVLTTACAGCHSIDPAETDTTKVGPNLAHLFSRSTFAGATFDLNNANLRRWLKNTQLMKPGNDMEITLTPTELEELMAYLPRLK